MKSFLRKILYSNKFTKKICLWRISVAEKMPIVAPILKQMFWHPQAVFLILTPEHGNLGDQALAKSETDLLGNNNIKYIELTGRYLTELKRQDCLHIMNGRKILINGGGFLGTLWFDSELLLRDIVKSNPKSKIVCFPNTIYYEDTEWGNSELQKSIEIYNAHKNLTIYAREKISYEKMKAIYKNVELAPDMVLSLNKSDNSYLREYCLVCLRNDIEKTLNDEQKKDIHHQAINIFGNKVVYTDMCTNYGISIDAREAELQKKFEEFARAKLVITDRLHGMIFSAITGTPCIVVNSKSPKIKGCYEWIKELEYIKFADDIEAIANLYKDIPKKRHIYSNAKFLEWHNKVIREICKKS